VIEDVEAAARGDVVLLAPELVLAEVVQALRKKERAELLTAEESDEIRAAVLDLPLELVGHRELVEPAVALWRQTGLTVHDALYLALAVKRGADLRTADAAVAAAFAAARG